MSEQNSHDQDLIKELLKKIKDLESRLSLVEKELSLEQGFWFRKKKEIEVMGADPESQAMPVDSSSSALESRVGEYGLAWIGNIVLLFGITFLAQYIRNLGYPLFSTVIGLLSVTLILLLSWWVRNSFPYLSKMFLNSGQVLLFYFVVRLHFFTDEPLLTTDMPAIILAMLVPLAGIIFWIRKKSEWFSGMWLFFMLLAALFSDMPYLVLSSTVVAALTSVFMFYREKWWRMLNFSIVVSYLLFILWLLNNPVTAGPVELITDHGYGHVFLVIVGVIYALVALKKETTGMPPNIQVTSTILNGLGFTFLLLIFILVFFPANYPGLLLALSAFCLGFSIFLRKRKTTLLLPALYALYSFLALSGAIYGLFELPRVFFFLSIESLLVLSIALWYKSRFIVVMNSILFVILLFVYWASPGQLDGTNFSFALVALATARILNWKKDRLEIKTDLLRNIYLVVGFVMVLYAMYGALPSNYITLSWTLVAILYFILSIALKNIKYRYMALGTFIATAIYVFTVDLARVDILFRVIAFMFLAIITISVSIFYARKSKKKAGPTD